ncbi:MarR family transcriptional regulator with acetyltransferase activity [Enterobacter sp. BIGb0383]|uniref:bifunctional helix-turn-helix transcriptional regulator/GNAT family N-acetyltransferase n=1 Tax=unclassified Enterobacter TaxID=2608935 RepID=UPI000F48AC2E|nr:MULTISPECIES: helix-turn-helix domain-containing GNAT family N-acetyltransferase [unclassified Enterobacter]ROP61706.1 MarR family transcriptional regulator with acetyltransferase activity [Enterobacter sp. BIGb0383]ROS11867.1 MarR family transcriptional regulator with acetyltransferase activity [Enterobacter sp. BIGb0359]
MMSVIQNIKNIRAASRLMVRELGFMNQNLATTDYPPSAVHAMLEVETHGSMTAAQLVQILGLEKSSVSRMLAKLIEAGELEENPSADDARTKRLSLTGKGIETVRNINIYADQQVAAALGKLDPFTQDAVSKGISSYASALKASRENSAGKEPTRVKIVSGYHAGMIGRITEMHGGYYAREHNFGYFFEAKVAAGLADFSARLGKPCNQIWLAMVNERIVGSVAIDGEDLGNNEAHLRWFILDDGCRGSGLGRKLIAEAMRFCDEQKFSSVQLWTFNKLTAARRLYESFGFELSKEWEGDQWGSTITEQQFTRTII